MRKHEFMSITVCFLCSSANWSIYLKALFGEKFKCWENTKNEIVNSIWGKALDNPCNELKFYIKKKLRGKPRRLSLRKAGRLIKLWAKLWRLEIRKMTIISEDISCIIYELFINLCCVKSRLKLRGFIATVEKNLSATWNI